MKTTFKVLFLFFLIVFSTKSFSQKMVEYYEPVKNDSVRVGIGENGDVLCYHIYNRNEFEDYLLNNTKLDTASSSRHGFGEIYEENGELYFNLNLQIRFTK